MPAALTGKQSHRSLIRSQALLLPRPARHLCCIPEHASLGSSGAFPCIPVGGVEGFNARRLASSTHGCPYTFGIHRNVSRLRATTRDQETVDRPALLSLIASVTNADVVDLVIPGFEPPRTVWQLGQLDMTETVSWQPRTAGVYALDSAELALLGAPDVRRPWRSGLGVRLGDGSSTIGWVAIGRGTDNNPSPFDELDHRIFGLVAGVASGLVARGMLISAVAERDEQATHLRYRAMHDGLTKVLAAHEFRAQLGRTIDSPDLANTVLIFIDLDGFKPINDRHGHAAGDAVLIEVADRLRRSVRTHDVVGRMGGDEFAVIATLNGSPRVDEIGQRLLAAIQQPIEFMGESLSVSASIGIAPLGSAEADELLKRADAAMYEAKAAGGGGWRQFGPATRPNPTSSANPSTTVSSVSRS
jgi:diguanylate cyclase (GGDEF)-like protein